jgi:hypothetical protein
MKHNAMQSIVGKQGDPVQCNQYMHWYAVGSKTCVCGKCVKPEKKRAKKTLIIEDDHVMISEKIDKAIHALVEKHKDVISKLE